MGDEERASKCARCGESLEISPERGGSSLCELCEAILDSELEAEDAELNAMVESMPGDLSPGVEGLPDETPLSDGEAALRRQQGYTKEDHDWMMNDPHWGRNPRDRD